MSRQHEKRIPVKQPPTLGESVAAARFGLMDATYAVSPAAEAEIQCIAQDDAILAQIIRRATARKDPGAADPTPAQPIIDEASGIMFYLVGSNSSHQFYLGVKDGVLHKWSVGEDAEGAPTSIVESFVSPDTTTINEIYLGHS